jgi:DNA-binding NarL/FixJ family response regulator
VLLSPFAFETGEAWRLAAATAVEECLGGDASAFGLSCNGEALIAARPDVTAAMLKLIPTPEWLERGLTVRRRQLRTTAIAWHEAFDVTAVRRTPFYNDVARPQGLLAPLLMVSDVGEPGIPTTLSVMFNDEQAADRHAHRRMQILHLLSPSFNAGVETYFGFQQNRLAARGLAEDAAIGVVLFDPRKLPARENEFFQRLMECEPQRDRVRAEIARAVRGIFRSTAFDGMTVEQHRTHSELQTATARYRIAAHFFHDQSSPGLMLAIALVERIDKRPLDARELVAMFSLTRREIEIAELMRRGLSSPQIASELRLSIHTVRRHVEQVMLKLDVHTRAAAAAKLLGS